MCGIPVSVHTHKRHLKEENRTNTHQRITHLEDVRHRHESVGDAAEESEHATQVVHHVVHQQHAAARAVLLQQLRLAAREQLRI